MNEETAGRLQPQYLVKVLFGLGLLAAAVMVAQLLPLLALTPATRWFAIGLLVVAMLALIAFASRQSQRVDELHLAIHRKASMHSLPWLAAVCGVIGVLQANDLLPPLNQFSTLGLLIVIWGVHLMLADRPHH